MGTTNLVVELVVIGTGALFWVVFAILTVFGYEWVTLDRLLALMEAPALIPTLSIIYILGVVTDRLADGLFHHWDHSIRGKFFPKPEDYHSARALLYRKSQALTELFEYGRSRVRVCRGWAINSVLLTVMLNLFIWTRLPTESPNLRLSAFGSTALILVAVGSLSAWYGLVRNEYERVLEQARMLEDDPLDNPAR